MSEHWTSDGALINSVLPNDMALVTTDKMAMAKEIGILAASSWGAGFLLSAISAYRSTRNPASGMPTLGLGVVEPGLDWIVTLGGLLGGLFLGDVVGPLAQTIMIGAGLGGAATIGVHYGAVVGHEAAKTSGVTGFLDSAVSSVKGFFSVGAHHHDRAANLTPEAQAALAEYEGS